MALTYSPQRWGLDDRWRDNAACAAADSDLFFPVGVTGPAVGQIAAAKAVCAPAPWRPSASSSPSPPTRSTGYGAEPRRRSAASCGGHGGPGNATPPDPVRLLTSRIDI